MTPEERYVEKLATPDVTVADLIGDVDPIKAARSGQELGSELTMHYGLLPRANRGIFAINEVPDLAGKIQVALFNIMQEGDVQIKGYPVRLELDVAIVFSANPEDYTARGKIVTPLKDRIGSEIRTHYPESIDEGIAITEQEAWTARSYAPGRAKYRSRRSRSRTTSARSSSRSPSPPAKTRRSISAPASRSACPSPPWSWSSQTRNAARCCTANRSSCRASAISTPRCLASPARSSSNTKARCSGADTVVREIIRSAVAQVFDQHFPDVNTQQIEQWFNLGGTVQLNDEQPSAASLTELKQIQGLFEKLAPFHITTKSSA